MFLAGDMIGERTRPGVQPSLNPAWRIEVGPRRTGLDHDEVLHQLGGRPGDVQHRRARYLPFTIWKGYARPPCPLRAPRVARRDRNGVKVTQGLSDTLADGAVTHRSCGERQGRRPDLDPDVDPQATREPG